MHFVESIEKPATKILYAKHDDTSITHVPAADDAGHSGLGRRPLDAFTDALGVTRVPNGGPAEARRQGKVTGTTHRLSLLRGVVQSQEEPFVQPGRNGFHFLGAVRRRPAEQVFEMKA